MSRHARIRDLALVYAAPVGLIPLGLLIGREWTLAVTWMALGWLVVGAVRIAWELRRRRRDTPDLTPA